MSVREVTKLFSPQDAKLVRQTESSAFVGTWFGRSILHTVMAVAFLMHLEISHGIAKFIVAWQRAGEGFFCYYFFFLSCFCCWFSFIIFIRNYSTSL